MAKPSLRDRTRAVWAKSWEAHKEKIRAHQKEYLARWHKKVRLPRNAGTHPLAMKAEVLFDGVVAVLKLACIICDTSFIVEKSRSNHRPKLCPVCQASSMAMQKEAYEKARIDSRRKKQA